jgi:hypothetical protein
MPVLERPLPKAPSSANMSDVWYDADGALRPHAIELPVDKATHRINGRLYACVAPDCSTAEWAIEPKMSLGADKTHCPRDGQPLSWVPIDSTQDDPLAAGRQMQQSRLAGIWADKRAAAARKIRDSVTVQTALSTKASAPEKLGELATDMKGHLPSLAAAATIEVGVVYTVDLTGAWESLALAAAIGTWGAVVGYFIAVYVERARLRLRKEGFEGRAAKKARERGLWTGRALISTGLFLAVTGAIEGLAGLDSSSMFQWALLSLLGLGLAWWTNAAHWNRLWAERRRLRELAAENARRAAEAEARRAEADALRAMEEARLREQLAEVGAYDENDPMHQGQRMKIEWERIARLDTAATGFGQIKDTWIVPEQTREVTAPDPSTGAKVRIGWEFLGACKPGALISRGGPVPPIMAAKEWIVSVLFDGQYDAGSISLIDRPGERQNTFVLMITEKARLGDAVTWRADRAVRIVADGTRYGYLGRSLTGDDLEEVLYSPGQPFGGMVSGTTGGGKGGHATRYILNMLLARMLPVLFDPKELVDYADFIGIFPIGFTKRHRRIIFESLAAERSRRQKKLAAAPKINKHGAEVAGESKWNTHDPVTGEIGVYGEPIGSIWDEFHDIAKDQKFLLELTNHVRFQRASAIGALLLSQGGGLDDWGNSVLRDLVNQTSNTQYRQGDLQSRLGGGRNQAYSTSDLPQLAGMCLRQAPGSPGVPLRAAYITRDPDAEDTVYTTLWGKGAQPVLQIDNPMNWISDETKALWESTGLMEIWRMAQGPGGLERLLADTREDEEDEVAAAIAYAGGGQAVARQPERSVAPSRMSAREVLLAILHETPGIDRKGVDASDAWSRAPGWTKPPADSTISRAAEDLDPTVGGTKPLPEGRVQKIDRGPKSTSWHLTPAGAESGARAAAQLAPPVVVTQTGGPWGSAPGAIPGMSTASVAEMAAQRAAEMAEIIAMETMAANRRG